jgi:hypothetical protein
MMNRRKGRRKDGESMMMSVEPKKGIMRRAFVPRG